MRRWIHSILKEMRSIRNGIIRSHPNQRYDAVVFGRRLSGNATSFRSQVDQSWGNAVIQHRGTGRLVENPLDATWAPGQGLDAIETSGWPDGRAAMVMDVLQRVSTELAIARMPQEMQEWINAAA